MRRSIAGLSALAILGSFYALTLFNSVSLTAVWKKGGLAPIKGEAISVIARGGALEFERSDVIFLFTPKGGVTATINPQGTRRPYWKPRFYEHAVSISTRWNLVYAKGLRIPLWPLLLLTLVFLFRSREQRRS